MRLFLAFAFASLLAGCGSSTTGSSTSTGSTGSGNPGACTITLSGAETASFACTSVLAAWAMSNDTGGVTISGMPSGGMPRVQSSVNFPGEPSAKTYASGDAGAKAGISITDGTKVFVVDVGSGGPAMGSYSLVLTSVSDAGGGATGKAYTAHGTLDASAVSALGGADSVTLHVDF